LGEGDTRPTLQAVLARLADGAWFKRNRLASALADVIRVSPAHARHVAHFIEGLLLARGKVLNDDLPLLEQLLEARAGTRTRPDAALLPLLSPLTGSSKTAKAAKQLAGMVRAISNDASAGRAEE
jgi:ribosomal protein L22